MTLLEAMADPNLFARWFRDPDDLGHVARVYQFAVRAADDGRAACDLSAMHGAHHRQRRP